jgi:glucosamine kinase
MHPATDLPDDQKRARMRAPGQPRLIAGVDGGGTGTRVRLCDGKGRVLGEGQAGPSALGQGIEAAWEQIRRALDAAAAAAALPALAPPDCALGLGLSGADVPSQVSAFLAANPGHPWLVLESDSITSLLGAHGGQPGVSLAFGTGSVGEVLRRDGSLARVGGWGWQCGDEGSGAWLGKRAMQHAQQAMDGRAAAGALARAVWAATGPTREDMLDWGAKAGQAAYAGLAPLVFDSARSDEMAARLLARAADEVARMAQALDPAGELPVALLGSITRRLATQLPTWLLARCVPAQGDSADGALHLLRTAMAGGHKP